SPPTSTTMSPAVVLIVTCFLTFESRAFGAAVGQFVRARDGAGPTEELGLGLAPLPNGLPTARATAAIATTTTAAATIAGLYPRFRRPRTGPRCTGLVARFAARFAARLPGRTAYPLGGIAGMGAPGSAAPPAAPGPAGGVGGMD